MSGLRRQGLLVTTFRNAHEATIVRAMPTYPRLNPWRSKVHHILTRYQLFLGKILLGNRFQ
ncbi:MAG: hypothetical protein DRR08_11650 [Candidatus Parabeggiatoa sp. nov. 2]|nr:MAG: hypothetical protein B6247_06625 [Beggiatoa sp. 4572_84]RKZ60324.1 MAG: hypothetical protein DRR08_11650 [Gammaproteobacteria bacterium]